MTFEEGWDKLYIQILELSKKLRQEASKHPTDSYEHNRLHNKALGLVCARQLMDQLDGQLYNN